MRLKSGHRRPAYGRGGTVSRCLSVAALSTALLSGGAWASGSVHVPVGQDMSYGGVSHPRTIQATGNNPASPVASQRRGIWFGLGAVSAGYEIGDVDNLMERAEDLEEALDREDLTLSEAEGLKREFDGFLVDVGRDGYANFGAAAKAPFTPFGVNVPGIGGTLSFDATAFGGARARVLDAPVEIQPTGSGDYEIQSRTSAYLKGAGGVGLSMGYSSGVYHSPSGSLFVGGRLNYYDLELGKGVIALEDSGEDSDDFSEGLEDDLDRNRRTASAVGLDLGVIWTARNYRLGATVRNLNEPSFDYPVLGRDCNDPSLSATASRNCYTAASFGDRISLAETYTMDRQLQLEAALFSTSRSWHVSVAHDANSSRDPVGEAYQWTSISTGYAGAGWLIPGFRVGYRINGAGSELSYYTAGLTLFRVLNLDAAVSTDTVDADGDEVPRGAMVSASLELYF